MSEKSILNLVKKSISDFVRNPLLILFGIILFLFFFYFSKLGGRIAPSFQTSFANAGWVFTSLIILLFFSSLISTLLISYSQKIVQKSKIKIFSSIKKFWLKNFLVLFLFLIFINLMNAVLFIFTSVMIKIKPYFSVSLEMFRFLSTLISFLFIAGIVIFFSLTAFFIVIEDLKFFKGIKRSINFVKHEYISTLSITVVFYAIIFFLNKLNNSYADFANYAIILPFMFLLLTRFVIEFRK